ncbi:hypothetical protein KDK82_2325 [Delftia sp. K82]|uniref:hypothetical protein n=1 Tax=Delftia sp. K82 TaxID=1472718 RepID=UPI000B49037C|nr:hypothetical protein [Delftia sp. K82]OWG18845.1 hypothetical protein KDK82_2325 [Delftia sp. K82]
MSEIIARSPASARPGHARKKATPVATPTQQPMSEAETLCRNAAIVVCHLVEMAGGAKTISSHWCIKPLQEAALLFRHVYDMDFEPSIEGMPADIVGQLRFGYTLLDSAIAQAGERDPRAVGLTVHCMVATGHAMALTKALEAAYTSQDLPQLRALATIQGASMVGAQAEARPAQQGAGKSPLETIRLFALDCSYDIQGLADAVTLMGDELDDEAVNFTRITALLRCYGTRIRDLNSILMSFIDEDALRVLDMKHMLYRGANTSKLEDLQ